MIPWTGYLIPPAIPIPNINFPSEDGSEPPIIEQPDNQEVTSPSITEQIDNNLTDELDVLNGNTSLQNVINTTLPDDASEAFNVDEYINDFRRQLIAQEVHCD